MVAAAHQGLQSGFEHRLKHTAVFVDPNLRWVLNTRSKQIEQHQPLHDLLLLVHLFLQSQAVPLQLLDVKPLRRALLGKELRLLTETCCTIPSFPKCYPRRHLWARSSDLERLKVLLKVAKSVR